MKLRCLRVIVHVVLMVLWGGIMKTLKGQTAQFVHNYLRHWQSVEIVSECLHYLVKFPLPHDEPSCCMQNRQKLFHGCVTDVIQHTVAVVKTISN